MRRHIQTNNYSVISKRFINEATYRPPSIYFVPSLWLIQFFKPNYSRRETWEQVFNGDAGYIQNVMDQVLSCTQRKKLLSQVAAQEETKVNVSQT
ncbi:hypothetical protein YC2023_041579 [Brassica napus]